MTANIKSPDYLGHKPTKNCDVARIGRKPIIYTGIGLSFVVAVTAYTLVGKSSYSFAHQEDTPKADPSNVIPFLAKKQSAGIIPTKDQPEKIQANNANAPILTPQANSTQPPAPNPYQDAQFQMWQQQEQEKLQIAQAKRAALQTALNADTSISTNQASHAEEGQPALHGSVTNNKPLDYSKPQQTQIDIPSQPPDTGNYLLHTRAQPVSPFEIKAGTVIPSVMLVGINSDLPGQIMALVSQNIYDSATGQHLLIPQGCKVIGVYDHQILQGQQRVLVVWHRLIYPDASSVNLGQMPGADISGYSGFKDKSDAHFWPKFKNAIMLSAITAGVQLSQPQAKAGNTYSSQQIIAGAMGQQMNNLGMLSIAGRINQPPTITIRPGYVFNVVLNKDIILPPWQSGDAGDS